MKKADFDAIPKQTGTSVYPGEHADKLGGRSTQRVTNVFGLHQFGVNRVELQPGFWSTQRHWHKLNDEAVIVISGELTLVTDDGEETLRAGDVVGFKAGVANAHHLQNRSNEVAVYYDIGGRDAWDTSVFPDIGMEAKTHMEIKMRPIKT